MDHDVTDEIRRYAEEVFQEEVDLLRTLARVPAPTRHEERRARLVRDWLRGQGMDAIVDEARNVVVLIGAAEVTDVRVFAAHTDVVFEDTDELPLEEHDGRIFAPGVGDDTANLVGLLFAARFLHQRPHLLPAGVTYAICANACEEGLGNLDGTRALLAHLGPCVREFVSFDLYLPQLVTCVVGSLRIEVTVSTRGGHSYHDFGRPNAIAHLCSFVTDLYDMELPDDTSTVNVGTIRGGTSVNAIASSASALIECRSTLDDSLHEARRRIEALSEAHRLPGVTLTLREVGMRPGMPHATPPGLDAVLERCSRVITRVTGGGPIPISASTDANAALAVGIPACTVGAVRGALLHTRGEWVETESLKEGLKTILGVMLEHKGGRA